MCGLQILPSRKPCANRAPQCLTYRRSRCSFPLLDSVDNDTRRGKSDSGGCVVLHQLADLTSQLDEARGAKQQRRRNRQRNHEFNAL